MYKIILNDGSAFDALFCSAADGLLTLYLVTELDILSVVQRFADPALTGHITFIYGEMQDEHLGYTDLIYVNGATSGQYQLTLRRPA